MQTSLRSDNKLFGSSDRSNSRLSEQQAEVSIDHLQQAAEQFNRLSESFVSSYHNLENRVESLADKLAKEVDSKRQQLVEKQRVAARLQNLLSVLPSGVVVLDEKGRVQDCNAVAIDLLGRPLMGEPWLTIINRCFAPRLDDGFEVSLKDGRRVHIETRSLDYEPGQLIVLTDLTETRNLQDRVNHDKRLSSMGKMMASLAHQVRTPLSSALIYASSIANPELTPTQQQKFSSKLVACLNHLERHVNDMLQFAKSGGLQMSAISVDTFTAGLKNHIEKIYQANKVAVEANLNPNKLSSVSVNKDAFYSAIGNIIDNAVDATKDNQKASVRVVINSLNESMDIIVSDNGNGIADEIKEKIFDPFYTTKSGGTGLGLAVVHGVVKAHNGTIRLQSSAESGTTVTINIPLLIASNTTDEENRL
ncbi:MAG: ATP-binding protein [Kangiellaceae bacterium]|jgi:two-component system sensor histidine kinase FlrB|nr:ATP-binding protein [Kangiellaceae bacterium]